MNGGEGGFEPSRRFHPTYAPSRGAPSANLGTSPRSFGGERGIRTPPAPCGVTGFQDQLLKPLGHLSAVILPNKYTISRSSLSCANIV